ncbi:MAG: hypothetical protein JW820_17110 [Spirochaetales bacterium]|nr:hypothetical protein [Spirochaetales bacterium]
MKIMRKALCAGVLALLLAGILSGCILGESVGRDEEPNDDRFSAVDLDLVSEIAVSGKLIGDDYEDWYLFGNGYNGTVHFEIILPDDDFSLEWQLDCDTWGSPDYGYSEGSQSYYGETSNGWYTLGIIRESYSDGGSYILLVKCE